MLDRRWSVLDTSYCYEIRNITMCDIRCRISCTLLSRTIAPCVKYWQGRSYSFRTCCICLYRDSISRYLQLHNQSGIIITNSNKDQKAASLYSCPTRHCDYNCYSCWYRPASTNKQALRSLLYEGNSYGKAKVVVFARTAYTTDIYISGASNGRKI